MKTFTNIPRKAYQKRILNYLKTDDLIFVIGARRTGKSCFAAQVEELVKKISGSGDYVSRINIERCHEIRLSKDELLSRFYKRYEPERQNVFLVDEVSHIVDWEDAVNEAKKLTNVKFIFFSSSRGVVSERLEAVREGRYKVMEMLPLSLPEFIAFHQLSEVSSGLQASGSGIYRSKEGTLWTLDEIYRRYISVGGMPVLDRGSLSFERGIAVADGNYSTIVTHDILEVGSKSGKSAITDPLLLRTIITVMAKSVGSNISATQLGKQTGNYLDRPTSTKTVESYVRAILDANLFYISERMDIRSDQMLKTLAKYYMVDTSLHSFVTGMSRDDEERLLENLVFFELLRRGYKVMNGKIGQDEVTFVAEGEGNRLYVQVVNKLDESNRRSTLQPLRKIKDNYPKVVVCSSSQTRKTNDGIIIVNALEFLMGWPTNTTLQ